MEIRRFFVNPECISGDKITLGGDEFTHMTKVLRYKVGFKAVVCANDGYERLCTVQTIGRDSAELKIDDVKLKDEKHVNLTLYCGLLKNNKLDFTIQKCVELGVDKIVPFTSSRTDENDFNLERARRIALESAKQCGSVFLTEIGTLTSYNDVLNTFCGFDKVIFAYEEEKKNSIDFALKDKPERVALVVGSEGGFTSDEADEAKNSGAEIVTLGKRVLRAETASVVAAALALFTLGELSYE